MADPSRAPEEPRPTLERLRSALEYAGTIVGTQDYCDKTDADVIRRLEWLASRLPALLDADEDRQRIDWLQTTREAVYQGEDYVCDSWEVHAPTNDIRGAIDYARNLAARSSSPTTAGRE